LEIPVVTQPKFRAFSNLTTPAPKQRGNMALVRMLEKHYLIGPVSAEGIQDIQSSEHVSKKLF
jgi:hypothetical protein